MVALGFRIGSDYSDNDFLCVIMQGQQSVQREAGGNLEVSLFWKNNPTLAGE